jgi:hypothetical protein
VLSTKPITQSTRKLTIVCRGNFKGFPNNTRSVNLMGSKGNIIKELI